MTSANKRVVITLDTIEGVGPVYREKLRAAEVRGVMTLLRRGATPEGRKKIAEESGISEELILEWINRVDLMRIPGVGRQYSDLLEKAGVDTVMELARRNPENLYQKLVEVNREAWAVRRLPSRKDVRRWVEEAAKLPRIVTY